MIVLSILLYVAMILGVAWFSLFGGLIYYSLKPDTWDKQDRLTLLCNLCTLVIGIVLTIYCALGEVYHG